MFRKSMTIGEAQGMKSPALFAVDYDDGARLSPMTDESEFETFYGEHARPLWSYVRRIANDGAIADDIVQESFLRFLGASPSSALNPDFNEKAYLYRIATNLTYDYFRRNARQTKRQTNIEIKETAYESFPFSGETAQIFGKLKVQERALLWLAYVEGQNHAEIAASLGLKSLSVRVLLFRARRKLANLLEGE